MPLGTTLINSLLNSVFGAIAYTPPATLYIALFTTAPTNFTVGTGGTECADSSYTRASVANNTTSFPSAANGTKSNNVQINFSAFTATATVLAWGIYDAPTNGNWLGGGNLTQTQTINAGNPIYFSPGDLSFQMS